MLFIGLAVHAACRCTHNRCMVVLLQIEGVWHTAVVIDGKEEIFFGYGINRARAGTTMFGKPHHIIDLG